ncbi:MAG TPA: sulfite oxidase, partial [Actinomycetota bacterium]|nr:sulfite oxidase [Actinomycetota bacterium]
FQNTIAYVYRQSLEDPGAQVTRIRVRSLLMPPGFPDFVTRTRIVDAGPVMIRGRAWSGSGPIVRVELGVDGAWTEAKLDEPIDDFAWRGWSAEWIAEPGEHVLSCRATDESGDTQPVDEAPWNYGGFGNNLIHTVPVTVR